MKYYTFTKRELDYFKDECNFTEDEQKVVDVICSAKEASVDKIAGALPEFTPSKLSITTFTGARTAIRRIAVRLSSSLTHHPKSAGSLSDSTLETPIRSQNSRIAPGV